MSDQWLSNTYLVAAEPEGDAFVVDAGGPVGPSRSSRLDGAAGVDDERVALRGGGDEVGVRQPAVAHGAFEDHGWDTTRRCRAAAGSSLPFPVRLVHVAGLRLRRVSAPSGRCGSAVGADYWLIAAAAIVVTSLDENIDGVEDDLGYLAMFLGWGAGIAHSFDHPQGLPPAAWPSSRTRRCRPRARAASARPTPASSRCATRSSPARRRSAAPAGSTRAAWSTSTTRRSRTSPTCRGIDAETARRIVAARDGVGGFSSLEDLGLTIGPAGRRGRVPARPRGVPPR